MGELVILVVEDEPEVRAAIVRDLARFEEIARIDEAEDVVDARAALADARADGDAVGIVLADHRLPGETGVDLLVSLHDEPAWRATRKVLITGQAGHADTIRAINDAGLDHYISKPWDAGELDAVVVDQLTSFVIDGDYDLLPYVQVLDGSRLLEAFSARGRPD